jgi:hypothetical protein
MNKRKKSGDKRSITGKGSAPLQTGYGGKLFRGLFYFLAVLFVPFLFSCLLSLKEGSSQNLLLVYLLALLPVFFALRKHEKTVFNGSTPWLSGLAFFACALMVLLIVWNKSFQAYLSGVDFQRDIFRMVLRNLHSPMYGWLQSPVAIQFLFPIIPFALFIACVVRRRAWAEVTISVPAAFGFFVLFALCVALISGPPRILELVSHYYHFALSVSAFPGAAELLRTYVAQMGNLGVHNNHYPPGVLLLFKLEQLAGLTGAVRIAAVCSALGTLYAVRKTALLLGLSARTSSLAVLLLVVSPAMITFVSLDPIFMTLLPGSFALYFFLKGLVTRNIAYALCMGGCVAAYAFFSFSAGFLGLLMGILLIFAWRGRLVSPVAGLCHIAGSLGAFCSLYLLVYWLTGFNLIECLRVGIRNNTAQMSNGFDDATRYMLRSTGAILAYLPAAGFPQSFLLTRSFARALRHRLLNTWPGIFTAAVFSALFVLSFCGAFFLETERIWLFMTPAVAVSAAGEAGADYHKEDWGRMAAMLISALVSSFCYELFFRPFSWR